MTILYVGGEPNDFYGDQVSVNTITTYRDTKYSRCALNMGLKSIYTPEWTPISSLWMHFHIFNSNSAIWYKLGFRKSGTDAFIGMYYTSGTSSVRLYKYDGTTYTALVTSDITPFTSSSSNIVDIQVSSYGSNGTINAFVNGQLACSYTGDIAVLSQTTLDYAIFECPHSSYLYYLSEVIIADEDTRGMHLSTLIPNAAGDQNQWTGAYTDVDDLNVDDSSMLYTDSASQNVQLGLADLSADLNAKIIDVHIHSRAAVSSGSTLDLKQGVKTNANIHLGSAHTLDAGWDIYVDTFSQNPQTVAEWTVSDINALQIAFQSQ